MSRPVDRLWENVVEITAALVTGVWMVALFTGQSWWLLALLLGYVVVVPIATFLAGEADETDPATDDGSEPERERAATGSADAALGTLRERYARGELSEEQFERKLERILAVETVEDARERYAPRRSEGRTGEERDPDERDADGGTVNDRNRDARRPVEPRERETERE